MEEKFEIGKNYSFEVVELRSTGFGNFSIFLRRGNRDTYRVKAFPYQIDDPDSLPKEIDCLVTNIDVITGFPYLRQERGSMLKRLFIAGEEYPFKVSDILIDNTSNTQYYLLRDDYDIEHRYYFRGEPKHGKYDIISLLVEKIDERKGNLVLSEIQEAAIKRDLPVKDSEFGIEDLHTEFKSSIVFTPGTNSAEIDKQLHRIIRTISAFMNAEGGHLWLGVNDSGNVTGIEEDFAYLNTGDDENNGSYGNTPDSYELKIRNSINKTCGNAAGTKTIFYFFTAKNGRLYCKIEILKSLSPVFVNGTFLFLRAGNQVIQLKSDEITNFIKEKVTDEIKGVIGKHIESSFHRETSDQPVQGNTEIEIPVPVKPYIPKQTDEIWNYFTFYKDGKWSFQKNGIGNDTVEYELPIMKSQKDQLMMMCYDNGFMNVIIPSKARSKKDRGKIYANGWYTDAKIMNIFITAPYNLIAAFSLDNEGINRVKVHCVTDFNPVESIKGKGSTIINPGLGKVLLYKLVEIENKVAIPNLIIEKRFSSQSLGFRLSDPNYRTEIEFLQNV